MYSLEVDFYFFSLFLFLVYFFFGFESVNCAETGGAEISFMLFFLELMPENL